MLDCIKYIIRRKVKLDPEFNSLRYIELFEYKKSTEHFQRIQASNFLLIPRRTFTLFSISGSNFKELEHKTVGTTTKCGTKKNK